MQIPGELNLILQLVHYYMVVTKTECCSVAYGVIGSAGLRKVVVVVKRPQIRNKQTNNYVHDSSCIQRSGLFGEVSFDITPI